MAYSDVYSRLVKDDKDIIGQVAYIILKMSGSWDILLNNLLK